MTDPPEIRVQPKQMISGTRYLVHYEVDHKHLTRASGSFVDTFRGWWVEGDREFAHFNDHPPLDIFDIDKIFTAKWKG